MKQKTPHTQQGKYLDGDELMWCVLRIYGCYAVKHI